MSKSNTRPARSRPHQGFTLLEVLIALLVMSIGLLGIGKMMLLSARANDSAYMRSQATALAYTILDAMRANRAYALTAPYYDGVPVPPTPPPCAQTAQGCSADLQAQNDMFLWTQSLAAELPGGTGTVATLVLPDGVTGAGNTTVTITVTWIDKVAEQSFGTPSAATAACAVGGCVSITLETVL
jgi:type IV pilus assembly protein PilV